MANEDDKEINPHIPSYMSTAPWYLNAKKPSLNHQRNWKTTPKFTKSCDDKVDKVYHADKYRIGACENCGAMSHNVKLCTERPRKIGAKWTNKFIAYDEKVKTFESSYVGKKDRWNGFATSTYCNIVTEKYEARDEARRKYLQEGKLKKLNGEVAESEEQEEDDIEVDEAKVDETKQVDFGKVEKRVRTTGGGSTGTVRNLRIREDTAKYLLNLDVDSAYYDPKTRSMREDPLPDADLNEKFYEGDNKVRKSGQALEVEQMNMHTQEAFKKGHCDVHVQAAPSQAELLYKNYKFVKEKLKSKTKETILEKYGNAATDEDLPKELLLGQSERQVEYDRSGRIIKGQEEVIPRSKYEEDHVYINNHTSVWGSWWKDDQWGYKCCKLTLRNSYCTGAAGIEAVEAAGYLMEENMELKEAAHNVHLQIDEKRLAYLGTTNVPDDLALDQKRSAAALKNEEKDERKRKYNGIYDDEVTVEEMEAYRMKRIHADDPMNDFLH